MNKYTIMNVHTGTNKNYLDLITENSATVTVKTKIKIYNKNI